jgi:hypothetical protein
VTHDKFLSQLLQQTKTVLTQSRPITRYRRFAASFLDHSDGRGPGRNRFQGSAERMSERKISRYDCATFCSKNSIFARRVSRYST